MSGKKKQRQCGYIKPHEAHTYDRERQPPQPGAVRSYERKLRCPGIATAAAEPPPHTHVWEREFPIVVNYPEELGDPAAELIQGPFECSCGMSRWLKDGRAEPTRFPAAEPLDRIMALKAKLDRGEKLDERDQEEVQAIADALVKAFEPLVKAFSQLAEMVGSYIQAFLDQIPPETIAHLAEMAKAWSGETGDSVDTIELRDSLTGEVIATELLTPDPISAVGIVSDEDQAAYERGDEAHFRSLPDPIRQPDGSYLQDITSLIPKLESNAHIHIQPGYAEVNGVRIEDRLPRSSRFGRASEH